MSANAPRAWHAVCAYLGATGVIAMADGVHRNLRLDAEPRRHYLACMERNEERPDIRFWTTYDHFMFEREARALRRKHVRALMRVWLRRAKAKVLRELRHAGARPAKPRLELR
jgi:hypothetical protein